jgi:phosphoribosyl 1,2-cyclic phosphate phosphodiesterase
MQINFLGTGTSQGIPLIGCRCATCVSADPKDKRLRSSVWLTTDAGEHILIDAGPDFRQQALRADIPRIDAVLITHEHRDHIAGLDDLRPYNARQGEIPIYALPRVSAAVRQTFDYIFNSNYPGIPQLALHDIVDSTEVFYPVGNHFGVQPIPILHGQLPILGFRFGNFAYLTDTKYIPEASLQLLQDLDVLVISALHNEAHHSHNTVEEAIAWSKIIAARQTYFMHMSHQLPPIAMVEPLLPPNVYFAYDGLVIRST